MLSMQKLETAKGCNLFLKLHVKTKTMLFWSTSSDAFERVSLYPNLLYWPVSCIETYMKQGKGRSRNFQ